jgi:hypothetical protein
LDVKSASEWRCSKLSGGMRLLHELRPTLTDPIITDFEERKTCTTLQSSRRPPPLDVFTRPHPSPPPQSIRTSGHTLLPSPVPSAPNPLPHVRPDLLVVGELGSAAMEGGFADIRPDSRSHQAEVWSPLDLYLLSFPIFFLYYYRHARIVVGYVDLNFFLDGLCVSSYLCQCNITWIINFV